jgi:ferrous iron transport protein A
MEIPVSALNPQDPATIIRLDGGPQFQTKMRSLGIREGKTIRLVTKHPFHGPVVVTIDNRNVTVGRQMAGRIIVRTEQ